MRKKLMTVLSIVLVVITTIAYSALSTSLAITSEAKIRALADIRVSGITIKNSTGATLAYESEYTKNKISSGFTLNSASSQISYTVTISNNGEIDQAIYNLTTTSNNAGLQVLVDGQPLNTSLPMIIPLKTTKTITITYSSSIPGTVNAVSTFDFRKVYYVEYETNSASVIARQVKYENVDLILTDEVPTKDGYRFLSWNTQSDGEGTTYQSEGTYTVNRDQILYAQYERLGNKITFDAGDGSTPTERIVPDGETIGTLPTPTRDGYHFDGWYTASTGGTQITTSYEPTENKTIYAHWTVYKIYIKFNANDGSLAATHGEDFTLDGNKIKINGSENIIVANYGSEITTSQFPNAQNPNHLNLVRTGYHLNAGQQFNTQANGSGTNYDYSGAPYQANNLCNAKTSDCSVTLYTNWKANTYTVEYNANGGTGTTASSAHTYDVAKNLTTNGFTRTGYTFAGWNTQSNGEGTAYLDGVSVTNLTSTNNGTVTLYAQWTSQTYTITLNQQSGSNGISTIYEKYNTGYYTNSGTTTKMTTSANPVRMPVRPGYTFGGYYTNPNGGGIQYINADGYLTSTASTTNFSSAGTLYAKWIQESYTISYNYNGGSVSTANPTSYNSLSDEIILTNPTKVGNTFTGWTEKITSLTWKAGFVDYSTGGIRYDSSYPNSYYSNLIKLKSGVTYTLSGGYDTYNSDNVRWRGYDTTGVYTGNVSSTATYTPASDCYVSILLYSGPSEAQRNNTILAINAGSTVTIPTGSTGNREYVASWTASSYTLTANANGGSIPSTTGWTGTGSSATKSVTYDSTYRTLPTPQRTGYTFTGWYAESIIPSDYQTVEYIESTGTQTITLNYKANTNTGIESEFQFNSVTPLQQRLYSTGSNLIYHFYINGAGTHSYSFVDGSTGNWINTTIPATTNRRYWKFNVGDNNWYLDNYSNSIVDSSRENTSTDNLKLFNSSANIKLYSFVIYENNVAVREYIPCYRKSDDVIGLYEIYTKTFLTASGTLNKGNDTTDIKITKDSIVKLAKNHTITAHWVANSYTVTANANSGSIASTTGWTGIGSTATKPVVYTGTYGTLPTVSRTGYTLDGWVKIPKEFDQIDYLENPSGKAIDTKYYWQHENIEIEFDGTVVTNASSQSLFGNEENITSSGNDRNFAGVAHGSNGTYGIYIGSTNQGNISTTLGTRFKLNIKTTSEKNLSVYLNDSMSYTKQYSGSVMTHDTAYLTSSASTTVGNMFIFANHNTSRGTTNAAIQNVSLMRLYGFKMYDNGVLVRNYIPVQRKSDSVNGLYDVVEKKFYTFDSNPTSYAEGYLTTSSSMITPANHSISASWTPNTYTVTYNANGGTGTTAQSTHLYGKSRTLTANGFTRTGYTFAGWNTAANGSGTAYLNNASVSNLTSTNNGNVTLYAQWTANGYTVTANANGGSIASTSGWTGTGNTSTKSVTYNSTYGTLPTVSRTGYTFKGWNGKNLFDKDATPYMTSTYVKNDGSTQSTTEYGLYKIPIKANTTYTITNSGQSYAPGYAIYNSSGTLLVADNYNGRANITFTSPANSSYILVSIVVSSTSERYDKETFQLEEGSSATTYEPYYLSTSTVVTKTSNHTIIAIWQANTYTVTYKGNGNTGGSTTQSTHTYDVAKNLTANGFNKTGYSFAGWNTKADGTGTTYANSASVKNLAASGNIDLYAQWTANTYTVTYNGNGATGGTTAQSTHTYDTAKALTTNGFSRTGYTFAGWSTSSSDKNLVYDNTEYHQDATSITNSYVELKSYSVAAPFASGEVYQLEFDAKGTGQLTSYFYGASGYLKVASVTNSDGWSGTGADGVNSVNLTSSYKHYSVRFVLGSTGDGSVTKYALLRAIKGNDCYAKNVRFFKVSSSSTAYTDGQSVTNLATSGNANLYAMWKANSYTITANANSGSIASTSGWTGTGNSATKSVIYDGTYGTLPTVSRTGYTLNGWGHGIQMQGKTLNAWVDPLINTSYITANLSPSTSYKVEYDITLNEAIPSGYTASQTSQWGNLGFRTGTSSYTYQMIENGRLYDISGSNYTVGQKYHISGNTTTPSDLSSAIIVWYTARATNTSTSQGYVINGTISNLMFYEQSKPYGPVSSSTQVKIAAGHTITANWSPNIYTVTYNGNGNTAGSTATSTHTYDETSDLTANGFSKTGYKFAGWNTKADGTGTGYLDGASVSNLTSTNGGNVTLYAQWTINQYTVTCEDYFVDASNSGKVKLGSSTKIYNYGATASGADWGSTTTKSTYYTNYVYKSATTGTVPANNNLVVYRRFWLWTDINIYYADRTTQRGATVSFSNDGTNWSDITNEVAADVTKPWGTTYYIKNIRPVNATEELDSVTNLTWDSTNSRYYATPTTSGKAMNIYMKYKIFAITLNKQNGSGGTDTIYEKYNTGYYTNNTATTQMTTSANGITVPSRSGYTFGGYYTSTNGGGTQYIDANGKLTSSASVTNFSAAGTLYAKWTANSYTITANANSGSIASTSGWSGTGTTATKSVTYDGTYGTLPTVSKTGYTLAGWNGKNLFNKDATPYNASAYIKGDGTVVSLAEFGLYKIPISANTAYTITNSGGSTAPGYAIYNASGTRLSGENYNNRRTITFTSPANSSYILVSVVVDTTSSRYDKTTFQLEEGSSATIYESYYITSSTKVTRTGNHSIKANWTANTYTVTYNGNGNTGGTTAQSTHTYDTAKNLTSNGFTRTGYTFAGWNTKADGTGTGYLNNASVSNLTSTNNGNVDLYAQWTPVVYTVNLDNQNATTAGTAAIYEKYNTGYYTNSGATTQMTTSANGITIPTRHGYNFGGYYTSANGGGTQYIDANGKLTSSASTTNFTATGTLYAKWTEKTYTLTVKPNGGTYNSTTNNTTYTLKYGDVQNIPNPTRTGYSFNKWSELGGASYSNGLTNVVKYCNANADQITLTTQSKSSDNPLTGMSNEIKITNAGTAATNPQLCGFYHSTTSAANKVYVHVFVAKLPSGYYFHNANNSLGTGATTQWLTSNEGTGTWRTYAYKVTAGSSGTFSTFGFVYVSTDKTKVWGSHGSATGAYTAYLAYSNIYDITSDNTGIGQLDGSAVLTANWTGHTYTATYYYQSNTANGSTTVSSVQKSCTVSNTAGNCSVEVPSEVRNSGGTYNNAYAGLSSSTGNMTQAVASGTTSITLTSSPTYYAIYRTTITMYYPSSTSAATSKAVYQNQWFTSTSALATTVLSTTTTGTSTDATQGALVSGYGTLVGWNTATSNNGATYATIAAITQSDSSRSASRNIYQVAKTTASIEATFYYQSNTANGSTTVSNKKASGTRTTFLRCTSATAAGTNVSQGSITIPTEVTGSGGTYNNKYVGVATAASTMTSSTSANTGTTTYYAVYRTEVVMYYPSSASASTNKKVYQNQWFTSTSAMATTVLSTSTTGTTTDATQGTLVSGYGTLVGWNTATSNNGATYTTIAQITQSDSSRSASRNIYQVAKTTANVEATFYYQSSTASGTGTVASKKASGTRTTYLRCTSATAAGTNASQGSITIPTEVTGSGGTYNNKYVGVATSAGTMTSQTSANTGTTTYYAVYRTEIVMYYPSSTSASTSKKVYQNQWFTSASALSDTVLSTSTTGTTTNATAGALVSGYATLKGWNKSANNNAVSYGYTSIAGIAQSDSERTASRNIYQIASTSANVDVTLYYINSDTGAKGSVTISGIRTTYLRCTSTTAAGTSVSEGSVSSSPTYKPSGASFVGWATSASTMTTVEATTANTTYYAVYRANVTNYYYNGSSYTSRTIYRNAYYGSGTNYTMVLSTSTTGTSNYSTAVGPGSSVWYGLSTGQDTTREYSTVAAAATSTSATLYTVYQFNVNYAKGSNVSEIGSTTGSCYVTSSSTSCTVTLPTISVNTGHHSVGWGTNGATTGTAAGASYTLSSNGGTLYGNAVANTYKVRYNLNCSGGSGTMNDSTHTYNVARTLTANAFSCPGKSFIGWSTRSGDTGLLYDTTEYSGTAASGASTYTNIKQWTISRTFSSGEIYELTVNVKGSGEVMNYFYTGLNVASLEQIRPNGTSASNTHSDGSNGMVLTSDYQKYKVRFTMASGSAANKNLLFRVQPGNSAYVRYVTLIKVTTDSKSFTNAESVENLTIANNDTVNIYAIWK